MRSFRARLWLVAGLAFAVRLAYVLGWSRHAKLGFDGNSYYQLGKELAEHHAYVSIFGGKLGPTALFPPAFPALLAVFHVLALNTRTKELVALAVVGTVTVVLIALLARRVGGDRVAIVAGVIAALYPNLFLAEGAFMSESLVALLVAGALLLVLRARDRAPATRGFWIAGLPLAVLALTRSDGALFAVLVIAAALVGWHAHDRRTRLRFAAATLVPVVVVVGAWEIRNAVHFHTFVPIAVNSWSVVGGANCEKAYDGSRVGTWYIECLDYKGAFREHDRSEIAVNRHLATVGWRYERDHLGRLPVVVAGRLGLTFGVYQPIREVNTEAFFEGRNATWAKVGFWMYAVLAVFAIVGAAALGSNDDRRWSRRILVAPLVLVVFSTIIGYGNQRFRMPLEPSLVVLGAVGVVAAWDRMHRSRWLAAHERVPAPSPG
jgi:4-amino-4-deoxy-L-arabinose transferase-like glycosyltransferase